MHIIHSSAVVPNVPDINKHVYWLFWPTGIEYRIDRSPLKRKNYVLTLEVTGIKEAYAQNL
jgi:hypothetical protein